MSRETSEWWRNLFAEGQPDWGVAYEFVGVDPKTLMMSWKGAQTSRPGIEWAYIAGHCSMDRSPLLVVPDDSWPMDC